MLYTFREMETHEGEILRLKIRGTGKTVEEAATALGKTRRMLYNYFNEDVLDTDIKNLVKEKLGFAISQIVPREGDTGTKSTDTIKRDNNNPTAQSLLGLVESNKILAEANKNISEANKELVQNTVVLIGMLNTFTADDQKEKSLTGAATLANLLDMIAEMGVGRNWHSKEEGLAELSRRFYGTQPSKTGVGKREHAHK